LRSPDEVGAGAIGRTAAPGAVEARGASEFAGPYEVRAARRVLRQGELVDIDGELGVRIVSIADQSEDQESVPNMPVYEYQCKACGRDFEYQQRMSDPDKTTCEACGGALDRLISRTAFALKGGGWYKDLYASPKPEGASASGDTKAAAAADKPAGKADAPASAPPDKPAAKTSDSGGSSGTSGGASGGSGATGGGSSGPVTKAS